VAGTPRRSLLYIPGTRPDWARQAPALGADAYILDLEDAVPDEAKVEASATVGELVTELADACSLHVRINGLRTRHWLRDLEEVVRPGLAEVLVPKVESAGEVVAVDLVLERLEERAGMPPRSIALQPMFESARGVVDAAEILSASARIQSFWAGHTPDGDLGVSLGIGWTAEGSESLYVRSKLIVDGAASGVQHSLTGIWADVADLAGLRAFAEQSRLLGFSGMHVIHPSHVEIVNEVFTPSAEAVEFATRVLASLDEAAADGIGAVRLDGVMIDAPMAARARTTLAAASHFGIEVSLHARTLLNEEEP
jgi:citrate lyase subunit beta / citryl-CoA lyase